MSNQNLFGWCLGACLLLSWALVIPLGAAKLNIIVQIEPSEDLSGTDAQRLRTLVENSATQTNRFQVIDNEKTRDLLQQMALSKTGLTEDAEASLLKVADAFIYVAVRSEIERGAVLSMKLVLQDRRKFSAEGRYSRADSSQGVRTALAKIIARVDGKQVSHDIEGGGRSDLGTLWRSAVLPGWGQYSNGRIVRASIFLGTTILFAGLAAKERSAYSSAQSEYSDLSTFSMVASQTSQLGGLALSTQARDALDRTNASAQRGRLMIGGLAVAYMANLLDAYFFSGPKRAAGLDEAGTTRGFSFALLPAPAATRARAGLVVSWSFRL